MSSVNRPGWLLRWGLPRDPQAVPHLVALTVSAVATILLTRGILAATGYPQLGGDGLHIAHVLWGGLLMLAAQVVLLSYLGPVGRPVAAVLAGAGFGLFIDEVGKFVTSDYDYFYEPAAAIMYAVLVLLILAMHAMHGRRPHHPAEHLAGAVDFAVAGVAGGFTEQERARAFEQLAKVTEDVPGKAETASLLAAVPDDPYELPDPVRRAAVLARRLADRILDRPAAGRIAVFVLAAQAIGMLLVAVVLLVRVIVEGGFREAGENAVSSVGAGVGGLVSVGLVLSGLRWLRRDRARAFRRFQRALLVSLLITQVFQFAANQFAACVGVAIELVLLAVVGAELSRLRRLAPAPPQVPAEQAPL